MIDFNEILFVIPARGGSKGLPGKNIKELAGKPLIHYSIEYARLFTNDENICLTTDSDAIINCANKIGLNVDFIRPNELSQDDSSTFSVLHHALDFYATKKYKFLVLLQPTSPIREPFHLEEALALFDKNTEAIVSTTISKSNPYFNLFEEKNDGYLSISKGNGSFTRRQDCPPIYAFNGSIYIFEVEKLRKANNFSDFDKIKKYEMDEKYSVDIDNQKDWESAENFIQNK